MKKIPFVSIFLILLGLVFEWLHYKTDIQFFEIKFWLLGVASMLAGVLGLLWHFIVPAREKRAKTLGRFKKETMKGGKPKV